MILALSPPLPPQTGQVHRSGAWYGHHEWSSGVSDENGGMSGGDCASERTVLAVAFRDWISSLLKTVPFANAWMS